jgi:hypothetical protein
MYFDFNNEIGLAVLANSDSEITEVIEALYDYAMEKL